MVTEEILDKVAFAAGYDTSDEEAKEFVRDLIEACIEDIKSAGVEVTEEKMNSKLMLATFIIYTVDNLTSSPGSYKTSAMYQNNVEKLRCLK